MTTRVTKSAKPKATQKRSPKAAPRKTAKVSKARARRSTRTEAPIVDALTLRAASVAQSITTQEPARNQLAEDVERFLARGGKIEEVPRDLRADPPKKPENNYGRGSI